MGGPHVGEEPRRAASCRTSGFLPPWSRQSVDRTLNLPQRDPQVLGADLNRSESRRGAVAPCRPHACCGGELTSSLWQFRIASNSQSER